MSERLHELARLTLTRQATVDQFNIVLDNHRAWVDPSTPWPTSSPGEGNLDKFSLKLQWRSTCAEWAGHNSTRLLRQFQNGMKIGGGPFVAFLTLTPRGGLDELVTEFQSVFLGTWPSSNQFVLETCPELWGPLAGPELVAEATTILLEQFTFVEALDGVWVFDTYNSTTLRQPELARASRNHVIFGKGNPHLES